MTKKPEKESMPATVIWELSAVCSLLDLEYGVTADMSAEEIEVGLRGMGLDPDAPPPAGIRHLFLSRDGEPSAPSAAAAGLAAAGLAPGSELKTTHVYVHNDSMEGECSEEVQLIMLRFRSLSRQGRYAEAFGLAVEALRLEPDYWRARVSLGTLLVMFGRLDEGEEMYRQVSEDCADNPKALAHALHALAWAKETRCGLAPSGEVAEEVEELYAESLRLDRQRANTRASLLLHLWPRDKGDEADRLLAESVLCEGFFEELGAERAFRGEHARAERAAQVQEFPRWLPAWLTDLVCYAGPAGPSVYSY